MKRICILLVLLLTSCSRSVKVSVEEGTMNKVYAVDNQSGQLIEVDVEYEIHNETDLFELYTIYQNQLPVGCHSLGTPNITLLEAYVEDDVIYYVVDRYIMQVPIEDFQRLLAKTASLYQYQDVHFILDQQQIS